MVGGANEPLEEVPVVDVFVRKLASPNILPAKLSEVIYSDYSSVAKKQQKAKPTKANWVAQEGLVGLPFSMSQPSFACLECIWRNTTQPTFLPVRYGVIPVCLANLPRIRQPLTASALRWLDASPSSFYFLAFLVLWSYSIL